MCDPAIPCLLAYCTTFAWMQSKPAGHFNHYLVWIRLLDQVPPSDQFIVLHYSGVYYTCYTLHCATLCWRLSVVGLARRRTLSLQHARVQRPWRHELRLLVFCSPQTLSSARSSTNLAYKGHGPSVLINLQCYIWYSHHVRAHVRERVRKSFHHVSKYN